MRDFLLGDGVNGAPPPQLNRIAAIKDAIAREYNITVADLDGPRRSAYIAQPRQEAYLRAVELGRFSLPQIGRAFGNRDHTTIIHGIKQAKKRRLTND